MKKLHLPTAMLGLTVLLTACPQPDPPQPPKPTPFAFTVNLTGVSSAPVKVTNTTTNAVLNEGALASGKTFSDLSAGTVLKIEPGAVNGYTAPAAQTVTLDANKTVTLEYKAVQAPGNAVKNDSIQGTVTGIPYAGKVVLADARGFDAKNAGTLSASGSVSLPLNVAPANLFPILPTYGSDCTFTGTASDNPSVRFFTSMDVMNAEEDLLASIEEIALTGAVAGSRVVRVYSTSAATIKGTVNCMYTGSYTLDLTLQAGWNAITSSSTASSSGLKSVTGDVRSELRARLYEPRVTVQLPDAALDFTANDTVTVPVNFYQDGAFNGQVSLSTSFPGLTVEPATLTLPALSTQSAGAAAYLRGLGLSPQRVKTNLTFRYSGGYAEGPFRLIVKDAAGKEVGGGSGTFDARRPGIGLSVSDSYNLVLRPEKTLNINVSAQSIGGFTGDVTFSATDLPTGVTVTPVTKSLSNFASAPVTLQAAANVVPGAYSITMTAEVNGVIKATSKVNITIPKPSVSISVPFYSNVSVHQGSESTVSVDVRSVEGFTGATTVTLTNLPAGVTATAKPVNITPGTTTTMQIPVRAAADAGLGNATITVTSPDLTSNSQDTTVTLSVRPARTALNGSVSQATRATEGVWGITGGQYDNAAGIYMSALTRLTMAGAATTVYVPGASPRLITTSGGIIAGEATKEVLISDTGIKTTLPAGPSNAVVMSSQTDSLGRVWLIRRVISGVGGYTDNLAVWNPSTGTVQDVNVEANYGYSGGQFIFSPDGKKALYINESIGDTLKIDTVATTASKLTMVSGASGGAIANDGTVWFSTYNQLARVNADDSVTKFNVNVGRLKGFDFNNSGVLWGADSYSVFRVNASTSAVTSITVGDITSAVLATSGGLNVITQEYLVSGNRPYYLSYLK
ncbi:hypothetical protein K7W42_19715 [Deinococcus sp. HMF7604]|uniref:hypothetical protein n=1 Tax=Deinococcus betulae TaxID=2873312 RepID=UPI001CCCC89D|nr:hypothetical protein [Deinococcus betulae]MBZ9753069.1 hypothetical protein [Deinococcus betulae]